MSDNQTKPTGRVFTGTVGQLSDSPWLAATDLLGLPEPTVQIEAVMLYAEVKFEAGRIKNNVPTIKFKGRGKELCLTAACNRKLMASLFGADTSNWIGQWVTLYVDMNAKNPKTGTGPAIRIKKAVNIPAAAKQDQAEVEGAQ